MLPCSRSIFVLKTNEKAITKKRKFKRISVFIDFRRENKNKLVESFAKST